MKPYLKRWITFICLPAAITAVLYLSAVFFFIIPGFRAKMLDMKKENIHYLAQSVWSILGNYNNRVLSGELSPEEAKKRALNNIRTIRYGLDGKDYFWIHDTSLIMVMHPYVSELNGKDISQYTDSHGNRVFYEMLKTVEKQDEGYVKYYWQFKDSSDEQLKESFVKIFRPWGWIIGTGVYYRDIEESLNPVMIRAVYFSLTIFVVIFTMLSFITGVSLKSERERERIETEKAEVAEKYRKTFETTGTATFVVDKETRVIMVNRELTSLLGYSEDEIVGKSFSEFVHPDFKDMMLSFHTDRRTEQSSAPQKYETRLVGKDGQLFDVIVSVNLMEGSESVASFLDVTELKRAHEELEKEMACSQQLYNTLKQANEKYRITFEASGIPMAIIDDNCRVSFANREFLRLFRLTENDILSGFTFSSIMESGTCIIFKNVKQHDGQPGKMELRLKTAEGIIDTIVSVGRISDESSYVISISDVTDIRKNQEKITKNLQYEKLLLDISKLAITEEDEFRFLEQAMELMGLNVGAERVHIHELNEYEGTISNTFEWTSNGEISKKKNLQKVPVEILSPIVQTLKNKGVICIQDTDSFFDEKMKMFFKSMGTRSFVSVLMFKNESGGRAMGFSSYSRTCNWGHDEERVLKTAAFLIENVLDRKHAHALIKEKDALNRLVFSTMMDGFCMIDIDGIILEANPAFSEITGYSAEELKGKRITEFENEGNRISDNVEITRDSLRFETVFKRKDDSLRNIEVSMSFNASFKNIYFSAFYRDITEKKNTEKKALLQREQLAQSSKLAALGTLVTGVAHEINNPNNYIMLNSKILSDVWMSAVSVLDEYSQEHESFSVAAIPWNEARNDVADLIVGITDGAAQIKKIVENLKSYARKGEIEEFELVDLNEVCKASVMLISNLIKRSTQNFSEQYCENVPPIKGNFQRLQQVVINLIQNSCHALEKKSQAITLETGMTEDNTYVYIQVTDQGKGMSEEILKRITDPFFTTRRSEGGTGLGLSISDGIVQEHNGKLLYESVQNEGTVARILLKVKEEEDVSKTSDYTG